MPDSAKQRPQFRNIHVAQIAKYRLPLAGFVSILHRISGLLMFLLLPFILYLFDHSLASQTAFDYLNALLNYPLVKIIILALVWAYLHHFFAGIRHVLMDIHVGLDKNVARRSAAGIFLISIPVTVLIGLKLFGVFY